MASTGSSLVINVEPEIMSRVPWKTPKNKFCNNRMLCRRLKILIPSLCVFIVLVSLIAYYSTNTESCVLYINGTRSATLGEKTKCTSMQLKYENQPGHELRLEKSLPGFIGTLLVLVFFVMILILFVPWKRGNYITFWRRINCCVLQVSLKDAINRYMTGYISDEDHFQKVVQSGQASLESITQRLEKTIPEVTFDVLKTGSLVERLGKPTILKTCDTEHLPIKSLLSTDFDVMLTPQTILASATEETEINQAQTRLFDVVTLPNKPGFVWLKLNNNYKKSSDTFWRDLCFEYTFSGGSKGLYLSSFEVRNVFVKGMKRIKRKVTGYCDFYKKIVQKGVAFHVKAQGPAVTVKVERRQNPYGSIKSKSVRPTLFYGDFIFAIKCIGWPQEAREWPLRQRFWPEPAVVDEIMTYGYHVVPKPSNPTLDTVKREKKKKKKKKTKKTKKDQQNENQSLLEYEWRLSYSMAEISLAKHIPPVARACFLALKATIKQHQAPDAGGLSSYHLKTTLFWALELNPPDFWCEERIEECFMKLVDTLLDYVKNKHCSHYFMKHLNLMAFDESQLKEIENLLSEIKENPVSYVSSEDLQCLGNLAACYECMCFGHGENVYIDVY